eukprot:TRINITY_DN2811_c0_g3_i2.p1 TRINITY_DN2811_c0_g3~~TRINITY_DN2811_c0_g3_i2.p1  ORF type:complete len:207 (-),score=45.83 TRINITY_DN2811_c0_g3_i2:571-1191(-)
MSSDHGGDRRDEENVIFVGNLDNDARAKDLERVFDRYGKIDKIDLKQGFAFIFFQRKKDAEEAVHRADGKEFGERKMRMRVELARGDGRTKRREDSRRQSAQNDPQTTLFVVGFDPVRIRESDLEKEFGRFGKIIRAQITRNFAFVEFDALDNAIRAKGALDQTRIGDRTVSVEYVARPTSFPQPSSLLRTFLGFYSILFSSLALF